MLRTRRCASSLILVTVVAACGGDDDAATSVNSDSTSAPTEAPVDDADVPSNESSEPVDGNATITLGDETYGFTTELCDINAVSNDSVTGVIMIDGTPAFVEIGAFGGDGNVFLAVGLSEAIQSGEPFETTLERGITEMWNLSFEPDDLSSFSDTDIEGAGIFLKTMSLDGSTGEELSGSFSADCT